MIWKETIHPVREASSLTQKPPLSTKLKRWQISNCLVFSINVFRSLTFTMVKLYCLNEITYLMNCPQPIAADHYIKMKITSKFASHRWNYCLTVNSQWNMWICEFHHKCISLVIMTSYHFWHNFVWDPDVNKGLRNKQVLHQAFN